MHKNREDPQQISGFAAIFYKLVFFLETVCNNHIAVTSISIIIFLQSEI